MRYQVLGPLQVTLDLEGSTLEEVELGPPKQRALLALLLLNAGQLLSTDMIVESLWAGGAPRTAGHSVQVYVSDLRRNLRAGSGPDEPGSNPKRSGSGGNGRGGDPKKRPKR